MLKKIAEAAQNVNTVIYSCCFCLLPHIVYTCTLLQKYANSQYHLHIHTTTVEPVHPPQLPSQTPPQQLIKPSSCSSSSQVCHTYLSLFHHPVLLKEPRGGQYEPYGDGDMTQHRQKVAAVV